MKVSVLTSQNVEIDYEIASIGDRVLASLIDFAIFAGMYIGIFVLLMAGQTEFAGMAFLIVGTAMLLYKPVCEITMNGQTIGKRQRNIRVARLDGGQPGIGEYLLRWVVGFVDAFGYIGLIVMLVNGKGQRLGDIAAGTTVVKMREDDTIISTIHATVEQGYTPVFPEVTRLSEKDLNTIKEVADECVGTGNIHVLTIMARKVKELIGVESTLPPLQFITTVLKDYNYYMGRA